MEETVTDKLKLAVFISGGGTNLQAIIDACAHDDFPAEIELVFSNKPDAYGLTRAENAGIKTAVLNHRDYQSRADFDTAILQKLAQYDIDLICLAGYMRIFSPVFFDHWNKPIINTHPALLPKHGGEGMYGMHVHKAVLKAGDKETGVSIHHVISECDAGNVIVQRKINVLSNDTPETLAARVLEQEHIAYPQAIRIIAENQKG